MIEMKLEEAEAVLRAVRVLLDESVVNSEEQASEVNDLQKRIERYFDDFGVSKT